MHAHPEKFPSVTWLKPTSTLYTCTSRRCQKGSQRTFSWYELYVEATTGRRRIDFAGPPRRVCPSQEWYCSSSYGTRYDTTATVNRDHHGMVRTATPGPCHTNWSWCASSCSGCSWCSKHMPSSWLAGIVMSLFLSHLACLKNHENGRASTRSRKQVVSSPSYWCVKFTCKS